MLAVGKPSTSQQTESDEQRKERLAAMRALRAASVTPRLLDVHQAAHYLSVSVGSIRDYVAAGRLRPVTLPGLTPREGARATGALLRVLLDRRDLDAFIDALKTGGRVPGGIG